MIVDVDEMGTAFGKWMRFQPNGRSRKNHIVNLKKILFASGNSYAPRAITSDWIDAGGQNAYHPQPIWSGELNLGPVQNDWRIGASRTSADVYGELRKNPEGGRINNIEYCHSEILIKSFMPEDALRFRRGLEKLLECYQIMLWAHYVLVVVSPSKLKELREQGRLTCYQVTYKQKLDLLQTTSDIYPKWLGVSRREIAEAIIRTDADIAKEKRKARAAAQRPPVDKSRTGPLWSCRIFASIHKFPIRHSNVEDLLPVSFSPQGISKPRSIADYRPTDDYNVFRLANGEIYTVISNTEYGRLYRRDKASAFLAERRKNAANFTYCHFDEWYPVKCRPIELRLAKDTFLDIAPVEGVVMIGNVTKAKTARKNAKESPWRFTLWEKPVAAYNSPAWLKKRGLTDLYERAEHWAEELLNEPEKEHLWKRGGRELGWYL